MMDEEKMKILLADPGLISPIGYAIEGWIKERIVEVFDQETEGKAGHVYFLKNNNYVKIGCSTQLKDRVHCLQKEFPGSYVIHTIFTDNIFRDERQWHDWFKHRRFRKEWYELDDADIGLVRDFDCPTMEKMTESLTDKGKIQLELLTSLQDFIHQLYTEWHERDDSVPESIGKNGKTVNRDT